MALYVPGVAEEAFLDLLMAVGYTLRLYTNDVTAGLSAAQIEALATASFTEATFAGYAAKTLTGGSWVTTQADPSTATYAQQTFTRTSTGATQTVYGYYVTRTSDGVLMWFEPFTGPIATTTNGDAIVITPTFTLDDQEATVTARGLVGTPYRSTSSTTNYVAADSNTDMTMTVTTDATRVYRIGLLHAWSINGPGTWHIFATIDGVDTIRLGMIDTSGTTAAGDGVNSAGALWYPTSASHTILITVNNFAGITTMFFYAALDTPRQLWVEDVGPR